MLGVLAVGSHILHHHGHIHILPLGVPPAVVISSHADHLIGQLGLPRELGLGKRAHVDDGTAPGAVHVALGPGAELGALHADDRPLLVENHPVALHGRGALLDDCRELRVEGVGEADVADYAAFEKGKGTDALGAVDDLVGDDKIHGLDVLLEGADGGEGDDGADAEGAEGGDVGTGGDLVGGDLVVGAMAGEEGDGDARVLDDEDGGGGGAPGGSGGYGGDGDEAWDLGEAGSADNGDVDGPWGEVVMLVIIMP